MLSGGRGPRVICPSLHQQINPNTVRISNDNLRVLRRFASRESNRPNEASDGLSQTGMCKRAGAYTSNGKIFVGTFKLSGVPS